MVIDEIDTSLHPLLVREPRYERNLARRYLSGSSGAVSFLDELESLHIPPTRAGDAT